MKLKELFKSGSGRHHRSTAEDAAAASFTPENPLTPRSAQQQAAGAANAPGSWACQQKQLPQAHEPDDTPFERLDTNVQHAQQQQQQAQQQAQQQPMLQQHVQAQGMHVQQQQVQPQQAPQQQQLQQQQQQQQQQAAPQQPQPQPDAESSVIAVAEHCPVAMLKDTWSLAAFDIRSKLYAGHISSVYRAVDRKSGITVGLKLYKRTMLNDMERHQIAREIWLHIQLHHPSIIALYAAWKDREHIYLVLEWAPEGNVFSFLQQSGGRLPEGVVVPMILEPTMSALAYIHELGMIHRDVKPENILLTTSLQIKLADFGLSIHANYEVANTRLGTIDYLSPEILDCPVKQHPQDHKSNPQKWYTCKVDVWSVGVLAYELLLGRTPFEARTPQETLHKIKTQEVAYPAELSPGAADFIRSALVRDPGARASLPQLLAHPWLQRHLRSTAGPPHMRGRTQTQSEVAVQCFGSLAEARAHASSGNMQPPVVCSADGAHNSCPQVLHNQMSAPAGELAAAVAASRDPAGGLAGLAAFHTPSPLGHKALPAAAAAAPGQLGGGGIGAAFAPGGGGLPAAAFQQPHLAAAAGGFVLQETQPMDTEDD